MLSYARFQDCILEQLPCLKQWMNHLVLTTRAEGLYLVTIYVKEEELLVIQTSAKCPQSYWWKVIYATIIQEYAFSEIRQLLVMQTACCAWQESFGRQ
jgi:hypothetical protein